MERLTIRLGSPDGGLVPELHAIGGSPAGRDSVHRTVCSWPGWRRRATPGQQASLYVARGWPAAILAMDPSTLDIRWEEDARVYRDAVLRALREANGALKGVSLPKQPRWPTERAPMPHQRRALVALAAMKHRAMLCDDMGLGKTATALWAAHQHGSERILVVCPASVKFNWSREVLRTIGDWHVEVIDGTPKRRASIIADLVHVTQHPKANGAVAIINYDLLPHLSPEQIDTLRAFADGQFVLADEAHYLKNRTAQRSKLTAYIAERAEGILLLTGTPIRNLCDDLFHQIELVRPGTFTNYHDFAKRHLVMRPVDFGNGRPVNKIVAGKNLPKLNAVVNTLKIQRAKGDVLDLPPKVHTFPELEMDTETGKVYRAMKQWAKLAIAELDPQMQVFDPQAKTGVEAVMRCEQIAQGFVGGIPEPVMEKLSATVLKRAERIPGRPSELVFPKSPKMAWVIEAISDILKQGGHPIVFSRFNAPLFWLKSKLPGMLDIDEASVDVLHGGLSSNEKDETITGFQEQGGVLLAQVKMAEGWNATISQDVLFLGRDWSPAINSQAEDRAHRIGQTGTVNVQVPVVMGTIEEPIHKRLAAKASAAHSALKNVTLAELGEML